MFEPLLEVLPSFRPAWEAFVVEWTPRPGQYWEYEPGEYPNYLLLADLARHLIDLLEAGRLEDVSAALAVAEAWIVDGEHYVHEAAIVGLLEDLQNVMQRRSIEEARITDLLGPEGRYWWDRLNGFWSNREPLGLVDHRRPGTAPKWP